MTNLYQFTLKNIEGHDLPLSAFNNQVILIVNVASQCGLTPQYSELQNLYETYKDKGFEVLGIPCNQFLGQEPGSHEEIKSFCETRYGVTFTVTEKVDVNGSNRTPLYDFLAGDSATFPGDIEWNFEKFLIDRQGNVLQRFSPKVTPMTPEITQAIEQGLK